MIALLAAARPSRVRRLFGKIAPRAEILLFETRPSSMPWPSGVRRVAVGGERFESKLAAHHTGLARVAAIPYAHAHADRYEYRNVEEFAAGLGVDRIIRFYSHDLLVEECAPSLEEIAIFHEAAATRREERRQSRLAELADFTGVDPASLDARTEEALQQGIDLWNAAPPKSADEIEDFYRRHDFYLFQLTRSNFYAGGRTEYLDDIRHFLRGAQRVLDFGSGIGEVTLALAADGFDVTAYDINLRLLDFIRFKAARRNLSIQCTLTLPTGPFDAILALDVLEHVPDPVATLQSLLARLAPSGTLLLRLPDEEEDVPMHFTGVREAVERHLVARDAKKLETATDLDAWRIHG